MMKITGAKSTGIQETTANTLEIRSNSTTVAEADANGLKTNALVRHKNEVPNGETWTLGSSENAILVGPITVTGSLVCNGTLVIL